MAFSFTLRNCMLSVKVLYASFFLALTETMLILVTPINSVTVKYNHKLASVGMATLFMVRKQCLNSFS